MKVRIGIGLGAGGAVGDKSGLAALVDGCEVLGFDSLWVSERVNAPSLDPMVAMTFAAARTTRLKVGTSVMVLPGRNPVLLAKAIASLDQLSGGRVLPAFGLGAVDAAEQQAFGVRRHQRGPIFDEALPLIRRLWSEADVTHHGEHFHLEGVTVLPRPAQDHIDVWLGGASPGELRRCGRLGDGWLPSFCTPATVERGIAVVNDAAATVGRAIDPEHFGVLVPYAPDPVPEPLVALVEAREPGAHPRDVIARGPEDLRQRIEAFVAVGASKFVVYPASPVGSWGEELRALAAELLPLQRAA